MAEGYDVVIGAANGDEGKGHTVNDLASSRSMVVRFNGSCQAGHTGVHNGTRHVFSHFGSGTLKGASTFLSKFFVCNPIMFLDEYKDLEKFRPRVTASESCYVTTPYEVALNIMAEKARGAGKHGSVGVGFGETIERNEREGQAALTVANVKLMLQDGDSVGYFSFKDRMEQISKVWVPLRCQELGIDLDAFPDFKAMINNPGVPDRFERDCRSFLKLITVASDDILPVFYREGFHLIFEGAQGLGIDQDEGVFPHVTRSNTGLKNVNLLMGRDTLRNVYYVMRPYTVRHGAGPFPFELPELPYGIVDMTNKPNPHQGTLRGSYFNFDTTSAAVRNDVNKYAGANTIVNGVITCMDQVPRKVKYIRDGELHENGCEDLAMMCQNFCPHYVYEMWGEHKQWLKP